MEAGSFAARATSTAPFTAVRDFLSRYALIMVLLALPVAFGIHDLRVDGNLTHLGEITIA